MSSRASMQTNEVAGGGRGDKWDLVIAGEIGEKLLKKRQPIGVGSDGEGATELEAYGGSANEVDVFVMLSKMARDF